MTQNSTATPSPRLDWVDTARGLAIVLVVFGHCWRGLDQAGIITNQFLIRHVDDFIYMFHMNAFFVLAGSFLIRQVEKTTAVQFLRRQILRLLYPLVLWTYIFVGLRVLAGGSTNARPTASDLFVLPLPPVDHMWFLWALFICMTLLGLVAKTLPEQARQANFWYFLAFITVVFWAFVEIPIPVIPWLGETMRHTPFLALGVALGLSPRWMSGQFHIAAGSMAVFLLLGFAAGYFPVKSLYQATASAVMTFVFLQMSQWLSTKWQGHLIGNLLRRFGQMTMAIFLAHTIFSAATRIVLLATGIEDPLVHLFFGTLTGVIGPAILYGIAQRFKISPALGF